MAVTPIAILAAGASANGLHLTGDTPKNNKPNSVMVLDSRGGQCHGLDS
jgi:hypothetical protein